jgi:hypothetical protein
MLVQNKTLDYGENKMYNLDEETGILVKTKGGVTKMQHVFEGGSYTRFLDPTINITPKGAIHFNLAAVSALGPDIKSAIRLKPIFDDETNELKFKPDNEGALKLDIINNGRSGRAFSRTFVEWLSSFDVVLKKYLATWDNKEKALVIKVERNNKKDKKGA